MGTSVGDTTTRQPKRSPPALQRARQQRKLFRFVELVPKLVNLDLIRASLVRSAVWIDADVDHLPPQFKKTMHERIVPC